MKGIEYKVGEIINKCKLVELPTSEIIGNKKRRVGTFECFYCKTVFKKQLEYVTKGFTSHCGCQTIINLQSDYNYGDILGECKFIEEVDSTFTSRGKRVRKAIFECPNCKKHFNGAIPEIKRKNITHCGCLSSYHGYTHSSEYTAWVHMKNRCLKSTNKAYKYYGGRGIKVCDRWLDFRNFIVDMGEKPSPKHSLDRIDPNGNYCPENCRWATIEEQCNNKRSNVFFTYEGETKTISLWAKHFDLSYNLVYSILTNCKEEFLNQAFQMLINYKQIKKYNYGNKS